MIILQRCAASRRMANRSARARAPKEETRQQVAGDLLRRCFEGSAKDLLLGALSAQPATEAELAEIRRILKDFEKKRGS